MEMDEQIQLGRAKNAVLSLLERKLVVPKIFLNAEWAGNHVDVLALDRDGVGDAHIVLLYMKPRRANGVPDVVKNDRLLDGLMDRLKSIPAQFRYIAAVDTSKHVLITEHFQRASFAPDGLGRIGYLSVEAPLDGESVATMELKPERFRASIFELADEYVRQHAADWEIRA